jgi:hypothetical protein
VVLGLHVLVPVIHQQVGIPGLDGAQQALSGRALGISAQILREREGYTTALERCQRGDLDVTGWLRWFVEQITAAAATNGAVIDPVGRKAAFWWSHRHSGFNSRQQKLLNWALQSWANRRWVMVRPRRPMPSS